MTTVNSRSLIGPLGQENKKLKLTLKTHDYHVLDIPKFLVLQSASETDQN